VIHSLPIPENWVSRYLRLLGVERESPSLAALARLARAQVLTVPFGNITSLLRYHTHRGRPLPPLDLDELLRQWEQRRGTGVCYEVSWAFGRLLAELGYTVAPVAGFIAGFAGGHQALVVTLGATRYLLDVGNGAPFFAPIPLGAPEEVWHVGLGYRFRPAEDAGGYLQERAIGGDWTPFCRYELGDQGDMAREAIYRRHHVPGESFVIGELRLVRCTEEAVYSLRGLELTCFTAQGKRTERLVGRADYARVARDRFDRPALPILDALDVVEALDHAA